MKQEERIELLANLGNYIQQFDERLQAHVHRAAHKNGWFTIDNQKSALKAIAENYLKKSTLENWIEQYEPAATPVTIGIVAAGNIPAVAFHDVLAVFIAGHRAKVKLSEKDPYLLPFLLKVMAESDSRAHSYIEFVEKLEGFDAVIATGSNNSARYFEQYFGQYPNIIRKNRNAVALLNGEESEKDLELLSHDIFQHFGLGCRNVSHIMVPEGYPHEKLVTPFETYKHIMDHSKYRNNYDYNLAIAMLNREKHFELGNVILKESDQLISPIGCLHYSTYKTPEDAQAFLESRHEEIQCVVSQSPLKNLRTVEFGQAQSPEVDDYADGVDTMEFLTMLDV